MNKRAIIFYILLMILSVIVITVAVMRDKLYILPISLPFVIRSFYKIVKIYTSTFSKIDFLLNAVENGDTSFKFYENSENTNERMVNYALNRIKDIISNARLNTIQKEKYYELILDSIKAGVIVINETGSVYQSNKEGLRILGLSVFTHINQLSVVSQELREAFASIRAGEKRNVTVSNELGEKNISMTASQMVVNGSNMTIVAISDINSELAEKELESWIRLIRVLTHEIMNSLAPITSLSNSLIDICDDSQSDLAKGLTTISSTSKGLISFVESYRKFTHIPAPDKVPFSIREMLERVVVLEGEDSRIKVSVNPEDMLVYADPDLISQVIINVVKNALQAIGSLDKGRVDISVRIDGNENTVIDISNNGGAIPKDVADNIFLPFFTTKKNGSGIGLSLSRQIMRLHNGTIRLSSNTDTTVCFTLVLA